MIPTTRSLSVPRRALRHLWHASRSCSRAWLSSSSSTTTTTYSFPHYEIRQTRFNDNDTFGHINNAVYYNYMDDAVNMHLIDRGIGRAFPRFIAENGIQFYRPLSFPSHVKVGLKVVQLGSSAVTYEIGFFEEPHAIGLNGTENTSTTTANSTDTLAARGKYVHVYVDETTGRPVTIPDEARQVLQTLVTEKEEKEHGDE